MGRGVLEDEDARRHLDTRLDQLEDRPPPRDVGRGVEQAALHVLEAAEGVEVVRLVVIEGRLFAQPAEHRVRVGVDADVVGVEVDVVGAGRRHGPPRPIGVSNMTRISPASQRGAEGCRSGPGGRGRPHVETLFSSAESSATIASVNERHAGRTQTHATLAQATRRQLDGALRPRDRADELRGLHFSGVLRARARGGLQAGLAERGPGRAAAAHRELLHQGARGRQDLRRPGAREGRRDPCLLQHVPAPREQAGLERLPERGDERHHAANSCASTTPGATTSTARARSSSRSRSSSTWTRRTTASSRCTATSGRGSSSSTWPRSRSNRSATSSGRW